MKINEVINEAGFWKGVARVSSNALKGVARAIAPQTVQTYDRQKNALRTPKTAGDPAVANITPTTSAVTPTPTATRTATSTSVDINKIQPKTKSGLPTPAELAKLQQKIQAADKGQQ
jgi:hypothetical protein